MLVAVLSATTRCCVNVCAVDYSRRLACMHVVAARTAIGIAGLHSFRSTPVIMTLRACKVAHVMIALELLT